MRPPKFEDLTQFSHSVLGESTKEKLATLAAGALIGYAVVQKYSRHQNRYDTPVDQPAIDETSLEQQ